MNISGILTDERLTSDHSGPRLPRPRPGLQPVLAGERHRHALRRPHPLRDRRPGDRVARAAPCRPAGSSGSRPSRRSCWTQWPRAEQISQDAFTTVGNWRAYGSIEHDGVIYGQKVHSLRQLIALADPHRRAFPARPDHPPRRDEGPRGARARTAGSSSTRAAVAGTPADYRRFLSGSRAELGITKSGYVLSRCGWFSDRSACYLASGRPVIAQETGFSRFLPTGEGLLSFRDGGRRAGCDRRARARLRHGTPRPRAQLAEEHFDSDAVLSRLLERVGLGS